MFERALRTVAVAGAVAGLAAGPATGQDWRNVTSFRQLAGESGLNVHVRYGAGEMVIAPGGVGELYRLEMRYDADAFDPVTEYRDGRLEVGVEGMGNGVKLRTESGDMRLSLSPDVPLDLDLDFGAVEATMELGGLRLSSVEIETGASDTHVFFSEPNRERCRSLDVSLGAAAFEAEGLGNAGCERVVVEGGVGDLTLDFSGAWRHDILADITMALGSATLRVPEDVGVRVDKDTFLTDFSGHRFAKRNGVYYSDNWESAERRLTVDLEGAFGTFKVRWLSPATP